MIKPYNQVPIIECGEPLVAIPSDLFALEHPHPYVRLGAPYGHRSPYYLRQTVLEQLILAQAVLQQHVPGWRMQIFDAYRPLAVQQFMVDYSFAQLLQRQGLLPDQLTDIQRQTLLEQVYQFWAVPSANPSTPPPHSTGAAIDLTLVDAEGSVVNMGSPIDELSPRSYPNYFAPWFDRTAHPLPPALAVQEDVNLRAFHHQRERLRDAMSTAGFRQHPQEWWHFSLGDQLWAWLVNQDSPEGTVCARYGAVEAIDGGIT